VADTLRILLVDGQPERRELLAIVLDAALDGCQVDAVCDPFDLADLLRAGQASAIVAAHPSPWFEGFGLIERIRQALPAQPLILLAEQASEQIASASLRAGVADLVVHDANAPLRVRDALVRALAARAITSEAEAPAVKAPAVKAPAPKAPVVKPTVEEATPSPAPAPSLARSSRLADAPTAIMKALDRKVDRQSTEIPTEVGRRGLKDLLEHAHVGWLRCDPEGLVLDCNDSLLELMESRRGDIRLTRLGLPRTRWTAFMKAIRSDGSVTERGLELRTLRGGHRVVSLTLRGSSAGRDEPAIDGLIVLAPAVDAPEEGEGELIELDEHRLIRDEEATLVDHDRLLGLSHDLQEPLRTVRIYADLLEEKHAGALDDEAKLMLNRSRDAAARMEEMVSDMVGEATVVRSEPRTADSEEVLRGVLVNLAATITASAAEVSHDRLPMVRLPARQMGQLLQNLVGNAIKYRSDAPPRVHISAERGDGNWVFTVTDNGMGISQEDHARIFEMFERAGGAADHPGSGIGLAVCRRLVESYGGRIWVESSPGEGSTFQFSVPGVPGEKQASR